MGDFVPIGLTEGKPVEEGSGFYVAAVRVVDGEHDPVRPDGVHGRGEGGVVEDTTGRDVEVAGEVVLDGTVEAGQAVQLARQIIDGTASPRCPMTT
ncbi:hypothetical protein P1P92_13265 [Streptomyces ipomoeae]|nr:hypothetical protein [Streptomyces ipomoeae]MDX2933428.1 hypothetical protein [Streptomyces ipomoeae]